MAGEIFKIVSVDDFANLKPFEGAANLTVSFVAEKGRGTTYPVPYTVWHKGAAGSRSIPELSLPELVALSDRRMCDARPVNPNRTNSQWQTSTRSAARALKRLAGASSYTAKIGARTDPYGVFQVRILKKTGKGSVLIQNCAKAGKREIECVERPMEADILFPLIRGRDIGRWAVRPELYVPMVQDPDTRAAIPEDKLKRQYPKAYDYFFHFKAELLKRGSPRRPSRHGGKRILRDVCRWC